MMATTATATATATATTTTTAADAGTSRAEGWPRRAKGWPRRILFFSGLVLGRLAPGSGCSGYDVGQSGAAKSTIAKLLLRFYDPSEGRALLDGMDVRGMRLRSLCEHVTVVLRETLVFDATVGENIAYGRPNSGRCFENRPAVRMMLMHRQENDPFNGQRSRNHTELRTPVAGLT